MRHINAPIASSTCCVFHGTAVHLCIALGRLLNGTCKPTWMPISSEEMSASCTNCGLLVSEHATCVSCSIAAKGTERVLEKAQRTRFKRSLVKRDLFANFCI